MAVTSDWTPTLAQLPALERAFAKARLEMPVEWVERMLEFLQQTRPTLEEIKDCVCDFYDIMSGEIVGGSRSVEVVFARQMLCYLGYRYTRHSLPVIARRVGYRDHTTAHHGIRKIERQAQTMPLVRDDIDVLRLRIAEKVLQRGGGASC